MKKKLSENIESFIIGLKGRIDKCRNTINEYEVIIKRNEAQTIGANTMMEHEKNAIKQFEEVIEKLR